jgi:hypothetical protein
MRGTANSLSRSAYFCKPDIAHRDRTGWLGWEDSNLRTRPESKLRRKREKPKNHLGLHEVVVCNDDYLISSCIWQNEPKRNLPVIH